LSSNLNTPYPPPDLLHPMAEKIQIISVNVSDSTSPENTEATSSATTTSSEQNASKSLK
jgi:hypothetical protein